MIVTWHSKPDPDQYRSYYGRFGGGWQRCLGIKVGTGPKPRIVLDLWFGSLRIDRRT